MSVAEDADATLPGGDESLGEPYALDGRDAALTTTLDAPATAEANGDADAAPGRVLADRYRLVARLGEGAHGEVWAAEDTVVRKPVALKWMRESGGPALSRIQREITTLRLLRVAGVVRLLDDGIEAGRPFIVMERVLGRPFPGEVAPLPGAHRRFAWAAIERPTLALLEVLARVHAAGFVHRDLKPDNLLVSEDGRPTVLDFGISHGQDPTGERLTGAGQILGTPLYLAPEQILGKAPDARADLYAVGVMLYEALSGRVPHEAPDVPSLLRARLVQTVMPLEELVSDVPIDVARAIARLLSLRREDRFRSALEALAALQGKAASAGAGHSLPRLGDGRAILAILEASAARRALDVVGARGSGRSRCLVEAAGALERSGRRVVWTRTASEPLASLGPIVRLGSEHGDLGLDEVVLQVEQRLRAELEGGTVVMVDDAEQSDPWSQAVLERCRTGPGTLVRALTEAPASGPFERLEPLPEAALRALFAGPDRLLHLREDAARLLFQRSEGIPARIEVELAMWARHGPSRWDGPVLVIGRDALLRLTSGLPEVGLGASAIEGPAGEPRIEEICGWIAVGGHHLELGALARVMGQPRWRIEADSAALVAQGAARRLPGNRMALRRPLGLPWAPTRRAEAHRAIAAALPPGHEGRLVHLLEAGSAHEASREALVLARRRAVEGDLGAAVVALAEGLRAARQHAEGQRSAEEEALLATWVDVAFAEGTPRALDAVLYQITRAAPRWAAVERLATLVRAGIAMTGAICPRALSLASELAPFAEPALERRRYRVRTSAAAARASSALLEQVIAEAAVWARRGDEPMARLSVAEATARLRYLEGRFEEAAAAHAEAAALDPWLTGRIAAMLNRAAALLEAFRHEEAVAQATEVRDLAARCRHPSWEARAEWLLRSALYRVGRAGAPDLELVGTLAHLGLDEVEALVCLNEAAVAFRTGDQRLAMELSARAEETWRQIDRPWGALLARCLCLSCGAEPLPGEAESLAARAGACPVPGIGAQALGLLGLAFPEAAVRLGETVARLAAASPRAHRGKRMDVISMAESLAWTRGVQNTRGRSAPGRAT
jgi:eukaryotic-like serine/threonine-protein kinase